MSNRITHLLMFRRLAPALCLGLVFALSFFILLATMSRVVNRFDEGIVLFGAIRVLSGDVPYRDFYAIYGPGQFYLVAGLFKVFEPSVIVLRIWDLIVRAFSVTLVCAILARVAGPKTATVATVSTLAWLSAFEAYGYPIFPCLLFSLLSVYCMLPALGGTVGWRPLLAAGVCIGAASLFRHDVGLLAALAHVNTLGLLHVQARIHQRLKPPPFLYQMLALATGILIVAVPTWGLVFAVASAEAIRDLVVIPLDIYVEMRSLPFPSVFDLLMHLVHRRWQPLSEAIVFIPPIAAFVGAVAALRFQPVNHLVNSMPLTSLDRSRRGLLLLLVSMSLFFFTKGYVRVSSLHMLLATVPVLMVICMALPLTRSRGLLGIASLILAMTVAVVSLGPLQRACWQLVENMRWALQFKTLAADCQIDEGLDRLACFKPDQSQIDAIRYVQERTRQDDRIFVGLTRHDRIFINDVLFYFASKRLSATRWHQFDPGVQTTRTIQDEMISELKLHKAPLVILNSDWESVREPNGSSTSSGVMLLDDFIQANYELSATFRGTHILRLRE